EEAKARLNPALSRRSSDGASRLQQLSARLDSAHGRMLGDARRTTLQSRAALGQAAARMEAVASRLTADRRERLEALDRLRQTLGHTETLRRGFAIVRGPAGLVTSAPVAARAAELTVEFHDGAIGVHPAGAKPQTAAGPDRTVPDTPAPRIRRPRRPAPEQGSLF
ncbi:MAG TPA: exodeoxyribonuclease VII large subunit, partial [Paracoccus sp. (in: a-proteobacteria)]|nr:exodeoxyribonuclease VII large subunit [Paracoccus sp. (in: a-proteobacteria)]